MPPKTKPTRQDLGSRHTALQVETKPSSLLAEYKALRFDYRRVEGSHRQAVQDAAVDIKRKQRRAIEDMLAVGRRLAEVKEFLPHGRFEEWIGIEFGIDERTAQRMMAAARVYSDESKATRVSLLSERSVYLLAAPSTPESAREEVEGLIAESGKAPTSDEVEGIIKTHKTALVALEMSPKLGPPGDTPMGAPESRMIEMRAETPALAEPVTISAARPDDLDLQKAGFVIHRTDQGYRYFWPTRGERKQSYGPIRSVQWYAEEDALTALALTVIPEPEPTPKAEPKMRDSRAPTVLTPEESHAVFGPFAEPKPEAEPTASEAELTPPDLQDEGITIVEGPPNYFHYERYQPHTGSQAGALHDTPAQAIASARRIFGLPDPEAAIDAQYTVAAPEPIALKAWPVDSETPEPAAYAIYDHSLVPLTFDAWLAAMPAELGLRQYLMLFELGKVAAKKARDEEPELYNYVTNALVPWSQLIHKLEGLLR